MATNFEPHECDIFVQSTKMVPTKIKPSTGTILYFHVYRIHMQVHAILYMYDYLLMTVYTVYPFLWHQQSKVSHRNHFVSLSVHLPRVAFAGATCVLHTLVEEFMQQYIMEEISTASFFVAVVAGVHCTHGVNRTGYVVCRSVSI